jgi:hypothetical protein
MREDNILEVLGVAGKEDVISNLLKYCIEYSASFRNIFLEDICSFEAATYSSCDVYTRLSVPGVGVPDLLVVCRGETTEWAIIENKLNAEEGKDQTNRYAEQEVIDNLSDKLKIADTTHPRFVFLTLFPDQVPESKRFSRACYSALVQSRPLFDQGTKLAQRLTSDWLDLLYNFYTFKDLDPGDAPLKRLSGMPALEAGYLSFHSLIHRLSPTLPSRLKLQRCFRSSHPGRRYYGAVFAKREWETGHIDESATPWTISEDNRHIHIEPQYQVLTETLKV